MTRTLDICQVLTDFEGQPIQNGSRVLTLKDVLLTYLSQGHLMGLTPVEEGAAYELGVLIGGKKVPVELEPHQFDLLRKLVDNGKVMGGQGEQPLFGLVVSEQAKRLVSSARVAA